MQTNPAEEWQQLTQHYHEKFDGELEDLACNMDDLTETAREVLRNEMKNRGLAMPGEEAVPEVPAGSWFPSSADLDSNTGQSDNPAGHETHESPKDYTWKTLLCECDTASQARQLKLALQRAGIDSWVEGAGSRWGGSTPRVVVAADQLERAIEIANQPIPAELIDDSDEEVPEYVPPTCPKCGAEDPILESAEPTNSWLCESCGARWTEPDTAADAHSA
jgi:hypothetical protein